MLFRSESAGQAFVNFSRSLLSLSGTAEIVVPGIGRFFSGPSGSLQFRQQIIPEAFRPLVPAEKVIRDGSSHKVLVGEKETTTGEMAKQLKNDGLPGTPLFRYASWFLVALSSGLIIWYISQNGFSGHFGNRMPVKITAPGPGYQISQ